MHKTRTATVAASMRTLWLGMPAALRTVPILKTSNSLASVVSPSGPVVLRVVANNAEKELLRAVASIPTAKE